MLLPASWKCMYVNDTSNCVQLCIVAFCCRKAKQPLTGNSLCVLGSLADLQQGTFDVTYLSLFFSFFFCDPFSVNWILAWSLQRNGFSDGWSTWKNCRKESKKSCSTLLLMYMSVAFNFFFQKKIVSAVRAGSAWVVYGQVHAWMYLALVPGHSDILLLICFFSYVFLEINLVCAWPWVSLMSKGTFRSFTLKLIATGRFSREGPFHASSFYLIKW